MIFFDWIGGCANLFPRIHRFGSALNQFRIGRHTMVSEIEIIGIQDSA